MATTAATRAVPAKRAGQPQPVGQLPQQRRAGMADHAGPSVVTSKPDGE